jgi:hypothetical protein
MHVSLLICHGPHIRKSAHDVLYFRCISLSNCDILHFKIIISTAGMPSALNLSFIRSSILSFSFAGISIHLFHSGCASWSCFASSLVMYCCLSGPSFHFSCFNPHKICPTAPCYDQRRIGLPSPLRLSECSYLVQ